MTMTALCRRRPPSARALSSSGVGHPHPRHSHAAGLGGGGNVYWNCHDQQQSEEGSQGESGGEEGDLRHDVYRVHTLASIYLHIIMPIPVIHEPQSSVTVMIPGLVSDFKKKKKKKKKKNIHNSFTWQSNSD